MGLVNQILTMIKTISLSKQSFQIALVLRDTILISAISTNVETWYNLSKEELSEFEIIDRSLFRRLLNMPQSTPIFAFYLELGILPVAVLIKVKQLMYLQNILKSPKNGMLYKIRKA